MQTVIPANPGTYKINVSGQIAAPIIGWLHTTGLRADPIFACGQTANFTKGDGIVFGASVKGKDVISCAGIQDAESGAWFATADDWRKARLAAAKGDSKKADAPAPDEPEAPDHSPINFGTTIGKRKSFWAWPKAEAVFVVEINRPLPDDPRVEKSTAKEMAELIASGFTLIDPHTGAEISQDDPEPETVAESKAEEADGENYDDMI